MGAGDVPGYGKAETGARLIEIARVIEPEKGLEHILTGFGRYARPVVIHGDGQDVVRVARRHAYGAGVARGVADEVQDAAFEGIGLYRHDEVRRRIEFDPAAAAPEVVDDRAQQRRH